MRIIVQSKKQEVAKCFETFHIYSLAEKKSMIRFFHLLHSKIEKRDFTEANVFVWVQ